MFEIKKPKWTFLSVTLAMCLPCAGINHAIAAPVVNHVNTAGYLSSEIKTNGTEPHATQTGKNRAEVQTAHGTITAEINTNERTVRITKANGEARTLPLPDEGSGISARSASTCSMIIWAADLVRMVGWEEAIAAVAATGTVGATVLMTMYAFGSSAFLAWAGSKCK